MCSCITSGYCPPRCPWKAQLLMDHFIHVSVHPPIHPPMVKAKKLSYSLQYHSTKVTKQELKKATVLGTWYQRKTWSSKHHVDKYRERILHEDLVAHPSPRVRAVCNPTPTFPRCAMALHAKSLFFFKYFGTRQRHSEYQRVEIFVDSSKEQSGRYSKPDVLCLLN